MTTHPTELRHEDRLLVIVGDSFLDRDLAGTPRQQVADMAMQVVDDLTTTERPGGAGLAAVMAARKPGSCVTLVTALGADEAGRRLRELLSTDGVEVIDLGGRGRTATKSRVLADGRALVRFDEPQRIRFGDVASTVAVALGEAAAVLVCDYGLGLVDHQPLRALLRECAGATPLVWDPHPRGGPPVRGTIVAVPNAVEAALACGCVANGGMSEAIGNGRRLLERWPVQALAITRGAHGAIVLNGLDSPALVIAADLPATGDACGAGDRFAVEVSVELGAGAVLSKAVEAGVNAASAYVRRGGPASLAATAAGGGADPPEFLTRVDEVRDSGGRVVATAGCFDVLHAGHIALLRRARALGGCLVVCLNSDDSIGRIKGAARPIVPEADRAAVLDSLDCVDGVVVFDDDTPREVLQRVRPDVYVKGGDYAFADLPERALVESWGGEVVLVPYLDGRSTTAILRAAAEREGRLAP